MPVQPDDWRLMGQEKYLRGVTLTLARYVRPREDWDHDHCEFCFEKFSDSQTFEALREGYATSDRRNWVCAPCFSDFRAMFGWTLADADAG